MNAEAPAAGARNGASAVAPPSAYRRYWRRDVAALLVAAAAALVWGGFTDGDRRVARWFFAGESAADAFPGRGHFPWSLLYRLVGWPIVAVVIGALAVLAGSVRVPALARRWRAAMALLLAIALGPGLLVNMILKDHWGRPRPVQIEEFGGRQAYRAAWVRGEPGRGKSFPCGHSSAGYVFTIFFLLHRRRNPARARLWLIFALAYGTALGWGRMIAGAHFLSDVAWSGIAAHAVNVLVYYFALNLPGHEDAIAAGAEIPAVTWRAYSVYAALAGAALAGALLATPHHKQFETEIALPPGPPPPALAVRIEGDEAHLRFQNEPRLAVRAEYEGFGAFNAGVLAERAESVSGGTAAIRFRLRRRGWFTEFDLSAEIAAPADGLASLQLEIDRPGGFIQVVSDNPPPYPIRLRIPRGSVRLPESWQGRPEVSVSTDADDEIGR